MMQEFLLSDVGNGLVSATVVLKHADGRVGFEIRGGEHVLSSHLENGTVISLQHPPDVCADDGKVRFVQTRDALWLHHPSQEFFTQVELARSAAVAQKRNAILSRHGRSVSAVPETVFQDWFSGSTVSEKVRAWLLGECTFFGAWRRNIYGLHVVYTGKSSERLLSHLESVDVDSGITSQQVASERELPVW